MKKLLLGIILLFIGCSKDDKIPTPTPKPIVAVVPMYGPYEEVWRDDFNTIDTTQWNFETIPPNNGRWWNNESQGYTDKNAMIVDGVLQIIGKREQHKGFGFTSSRMTTQDKFEFKYGRVEARMKVPGDNGTWPAFWMLGANIDTVPWPACGELDIMEHNQGNQENIVSAAIHTTKANGANAVSASHALDPNEFHTYALDWTAGRILFKVDGRTILDTFRAGDPFDKDFFLLLNLAIGGDFVGDVDADFKEAIFEIDYIKVEQRKRLN